MHNKLMTNSERKRRHLTENSICPRCNLFDEIVNHILCECHYVVDVWNNLGLHEFYSTQNMAMSRDNIPGSQPMPRRTIAIDWDPGSEGWVTVNTDGSVVQSIGNTPTGGLIRDHLGRCFSAFSANLGRCSITRAELRGILHGLEFS
ncbi:Putative ribonuclease H protein At1g65750 [Linum perenne]